jgi:hypothetical protein
VRLWKSVISVTPDSSNTKADLAQVACQLGRSIELLDVAFLGPPVLSSGFSESGDLAR